MLKQWWLSELHGSYSCLILLDGVIDQASFNSFNK